MVANGALNLSRTQFAVVRAYLQGVPLSFIAGRYLSIPGENPEHQPDLRLVHRTIQSYLHTLVGIAHQHGQSALAALLEKSATSSGVGVQRAIDAVNSLERLGKIQPRAMHAVTLWFAPPLARRLTRAGLLTLADIAALANRRGSGWWRYVPRIGRKAAGVIIDWLKQHQALLGAHALSDEILSPRAPMSITAIAPHSPKVVPLEWISPTPHALDGSHGKNRGPRDSCLLPARTDLQAIYAWLGLYREGSSTWRAYRKEAERFLLWAIVERGCALSDLTGEDCLAYRAFLASPAPSSRWIGPMTDRGFRSWRPFQGPLSMSSCRFAQTVLTSLGTWLVDQGYLAANPWKDIPGLARIPTPNHLPYTPLRHTETLLRWLEREASRPDFPGKQARVVYAAFLLLAQSGWRRQEACTATRNMLSLVATPAPTAHDIAMTGQGRNGSTFFLRSNAVQALRRHWTDRGLDFDHVCDAPLLAPLAYPNTPQSRRKRTSGQVGYSPEGLHRLIKSAAIRFAKEHGLPECDVLALRADAIRHLKVV